MVLPPWKNSFFPVFLALAILFGCQKEPETTAPEEAYQLQVPEGFPYPIIPEDNLPTAARVELGKKLFFDTRLSLDESISCASCHKQNRAFTDDERLSSGVDGQKGLRNSPTLANVAYQKKFMMDGGVTTLELQSLAPIHDENEMNFDVSKAVTRLNNDPELKDLSKRGYQRDSIDSFVLTRALANFQRTFLSGNSRYDQYKYQGDKNALSKQEIRGMDLFFGEETQCGSCHSGVNFSDGGYHNVGLYEQYEDSGRERISNSASDKGKFKTPTLRNVSLTAPYMHDGSIETLEEVIDHFDQGGVAHGNKDPRIRPLNLSASKKEDLREFLESLTDNEFLENTDLAIDESEEE